VCNARITSHLEFHTADQDAVYGVAVSQQRRYRLPHMIMSQAGGRLMRIALYQPDIPQNTGTILRLCACLGIAGDIIEPAGFPVSDRHFRRAGMDYLDQVEIVRHASWSAFCDWRQARGQRLVLFTTKAAQPYLDFSFAADDILLFGRESAGVPDDVAARADARLLIPVAPGLRSLNVAMAAAMAAGEALRQTRR
jgi:tRNA (cytidine/uridine-2'-O-)-methyltransferase